MNHSFFKKEDLELITEAVIYCRISSQQQTKNGSLRRQMECCCEWADKMKLTVVAVFSEIGTAWARENWKGLPSLAQAAMVARHRDAVLVFEAWDRISRGCGFPSACLAAVYDWLPYDSE